MEAKPRTLRWYRTVEDTEPCSDWLRKLRDTKGRAAIRVALDRLESGNFSNCKSVGGGVHELRINFGPGYRVYFGEDGDSVILLFGGDKHTQSPDILRSKEFWKDYNA